MKFILLSALIFFIGCGSQDVKKIKNFRLTYQNKQFDESLQLLPKVFSKDKSLLLQYMELGDIHFQKNDIKKALSYFDKAINLQKQMYTTKISGKLKALSSNDKSDYYYGETYEHSVLRFYQTLSFYKKYIDNPKTNAKYLQKARSSVLEWDSYLSSILSDKKGKDVFKKDLLALIFGAFIHESMDTYNDLQTVLILYKNAKKVLFQNYNVYEVYNKKHMDFRKNFTNLHKLKHLEVKKFTSPTLHYTQLNEFLTFKVKEIAKKINASHVVLDPASLSKKYSSQLKANKKSNTAIMVLQNMVIPKEVEQYNFNLESLMKNNSKAVNAIGAVGFVALSSFAINQMGLSQVSNLSPAKAFWGAEVGKQAALGIGINFQLPNMTTPKLKEIPICIIKVYKKSKTFKKFELPIIAPINHIAEKTIKETSGDRYVRLGTRLGLKHVTALLASYGTYNLTKEKSPFLAKSLALAQYLAAVKLIDYSEQADLRHWMTLPGYVNFNDFHLPVGKYRAEVFLKSQNGIILAKKQIDLNVKKNVKKKLHIIKI